MSRSATMPGAKPLRWVGSRLGRGLHFCLVVCALVLSGCGETEQPLRIGTKGFTEQIILGQIIAAVAEAENIPVVRSIPYGDTFETIEALKRGDIDIYPEYNGTGLVLLGQPPISDGDLASARVEALYAPLGLVWGRRFGFHNDYELVMRADRAAALGITKISDLPNIGGPVRFGVDKEFTTRPVDGFAPLLRRYGLDGTPALVVESTATGKAKLYEALLEREVDVVAGLSTDGHIAEFGLVALEDDLAFFPTYEPAPLVRDDARRRFPRLQPALERLAGKISTKDMGAMSAAVDLDGQDPRAVARRFLAERNLIAVEPQPLVTEELRIAADDLDAPSGHTARARAAVRKTFPGRIVRFLTLPDPLQAVLTGKARLALVGGGAFYDLAGGVFPTPRDGTEALGVVGYDMAHLIVRSGSDIRSLANVKALGIGAAGSNSERTARMVLTSLGLIDQVELIAVGGGGEAAIDVQAARLRGGELDALFLMAAKGHPKITELLAGGRLHLLPLGEWQDGNNLIRFPFLRVSRIPVGAYPGVREPVDTIGAQVVLAGPAPKGDPIGTAGPGSAAVGEILPLADKSILSLKENLATEELLDPALPSAVILRPQPKQAPAEINPSATQSLVNLIVICAMIYLAYLYFCREPIWPRRRDTTLPPTDIGGSSER
ncbi:MAG: hypothetical protein GEU95_24555 [Rhizobiales bacterium]|nr:hypothetical protein [Hyphomicrobiales bacterium]